MAAEDIKKKTRYHEARRARKNEEFARRHYEIFKMYEKLSTDSKYDNKKREHFKQRSIEAEGLAKEFERIAERHKQNADILRQA